MHVTDVKGSAVTGQTAGAQRRQTAAVRQLRQRVVLVSELGELRGAEELPDSRNHRADVDQRLRGQLVVVLRGHALLDDLLHADKADTELVLELLTDRTDAAVAEVVDIIHGADPVCQIQHIADGSKDVVLCDVLGAQLGNTQAHLPFDLVQVTAARLHDLLQDRGAHLLAHAAVMQVTADDILRLQRVVGQHADDVPVLQPDVHAVDTAVLDGKCQLGIDGRPGGAEQLAGQRRDDIVCRHLPGDTSGDRHLLVELVPTHGCDVVPLRIKEIIVNQHLGGFHQRRLAGAQSLVDLLERLHMGSGMVLGGKILALVLLERDLQPVVLTQQLIDLLAGLGAQCADEHGDRHLAGLVHPDVHHAVDIRLVLQPCAAVGDDLRGKNRLTRLVDVAGVVHAGRTDDLGHNDALGAVDDKGARLGHEWELTHKDIRLLDLAGLLIRQPDVDLEGRGVVDVPLLALLHGIVGLVAQRVGDELDKKIAGKVGNGGHLMQDLGQSLPEEPGVGAGLDLHQIRQLQVEAGAGKRFPDVLAELLVFQLNHVQQSLHSFMIGRCGGREARRIRRTVRYPLPSSAAAGVGIASGRRSRHKRAGPRRRFGQGNHPGHGKCLGHTHDRLRRAGSP